MDDNVEYNTSSPTYKSVKDYMNMIKQIASSSGLLLKRYNMMKGQIENINSIVKQVKDAAIPSIKHDLVNIMNNTTDWNYYRNRLITEIKSKAKNNNMKYKQLQQFDFNYEDAYIPLNDVNASKMNAIVTSINSDRKLNDKNKHDIKEYNKCKNVLFEEMDTTLQSLKMFENNVVNCRTKNIPILNHNIEVLYNIHYNYVNDIINKKITPRHKYVEYNNGNDIIQIPLKKSQHEFIVDGIKQMLNI